jgi:NNP family nitrate/nitrite transporter-like MFS transporter
MTTARMVSAMGLEGTDAVAGSQGTAGAGDTFGGVSRPPSLALPCLAAAAQAATFTNHAPLIPLILGDVGVTPAQAGFLSTATFLVGGALSPPLGTLTDRLGPRRVAAVAMVLAAASTVGFALAGSYALMLAMRVVAAVSLASVFVAGGQYVNTHWRGDHLFFAQGLHGGAIQLGIGASILGLPLLAEPFGWRTAMLASAVPPVLMLGVWLRSAVDAPHPPGAGVAAAPGRRPGMTAAFGNATAWRLGIAHTSLFGTSIVLATWISAYLSHEFSLRLGLAGVLGSLGLLTASLGRPAGGIVIARGWVGPRRLILLTLAGTAAAVGLMALPGRPLAVAVLGIVLAGLSTALGFAPVVTLAGRAEPRAPASALGLVAMVSTVTVVVGAPLVGALWSASGHFSVPLGLLALVPAGAILLALGLAEE